MAAARPLKPGSVLHHVGRLISWNMLSSLSLQISKLETPSLLVRGLLQRYDAFRGTHSSRLELYLCLSDTNEQFKSSRVIAGLVTSSKLFHICFRVSIGERDYPLSSLCLGQPSAENARCLCISPGKGRILAYASWTAAYQTPLYTQVFLESCVWIHSI